MACHFCRREDRIEQSLLPSVARKNLRIHFEAWPQALDLEQEKSRLEEQGISSTVIDMHTIKPLDEKALLELLSTKLLVTVEEHNVMGGLGGAVSEFLAGISNKPPQLILGIDDKFDHAASYPHLLEQSGLTAPQIAQSIYKKYKELKQRD